MKPDNFHKDNHFVPQSYLKRWQSSNKKVFEYKTLVSHEKVPKWKERSIKGTAFHSHLYTQIMSGRQTDEVERWFDKRYEAPAEISIAKAVSNKRLSKSDWYTLVMFLAAQDVRTPKKYIEHLVRTKKNLPEIMEETIQSLEKQLEERRIKKTKATNLKKDLEYAFPLSISITDSDKKNYSEVKVETTPGRSTWLFGIKHLLSNTASNLLKNKWTIVQPAKGMIWPTSDNPVIKLNYYKPGKYDFKGGWNNPGTEIMFPLSPLHLMYAQVGMRPPKRGSKFSIEQTKLIRQFIAEHAYRKVFSNRIDKDIELYRPRTINQQQFISEQRQWDKWHNEQSEVEVRYFD